MWSYSVPVRSDELWHSGRPGTKWHEHKFGRWDKRATYANGQPDAGKYTGDVGTVRELTDSARLAYKYSNIRLKQLEQSLGLRDSGAQQELTRDR